MTMTEPIHLDGKNPAWVAESGKPLTIYRHGLTAEERVEVADHMRKITTGCVIRLDKRDEN